jgi:hypothetical protein
MTVSNIQPQTRLLIQLQTIEPLIDDFLYQLDEEIEPPLNEQYTLIFKNLRIALDNISSTIDLLKEKTQ